MNKIIYIMFLCCALEGALVPIANAKTIGGLEWNVSGALESNFSRVPYVPGKVQSPTDPGNYTPYEMNWDDNKMHIRNKFRIQLQVSDDHTLAGSEELYGKAATIDGKGWIESFQDIPDQPSVYGKEGEALVAGVICVSNFSASSPGFPFSPFAGFVVIKARAKVRLQRSVIGIGGLPGVYKWWDVTGRQEDDYETKLVLNGRCPYVKGNINNIWSDAFAKMSVDEIAEVVKQFPTQLEEFHQRARHKDY